MNIKTILLIAQMIPALIDIVKKAEEILPESGKGSEKLSFVKEVLEGVHSVVTDNWPTIEKIIGVIVSFFNKSDGFKKE